MATPSLKRTLNDCLVECGKVDAIRGQVADMPARVQFLVAEVLLLRLTSILEGSIAEVAFKIASGATYLDGETPKILVPCTSIVNARTKMLAEGRDRARQNLKWTRAKFIKDSVRHVVDPADHYLATCTNYGSMLAQMFKVRNFVAHRNASSRVEYREAIREVYGRERKLAVGPFLLSNNYVPIPNLDRYIIQTRAFMRELTRSP